MHRKHPALIIPGEEVRTREGFDLIGLYLSREIPEGTGAREACDLIREDGGIVYLPHPFAPGKGSGRKHVEALTPFVDVVEVFNARLHPGRLNQPAMALAGAHGKLTGAGSDAHTLREVGKAWVDVPAHENNSEALLEALAKATVSGETAPLWIHLASTWAKVRKAFPGSGA
jgi:predicted metal-dependent phosphoesterase TrpH